MCEKVVKNAMRYQGSLCQRNIAALCERIISICENEQDRAAFRRMTLPK